MRVGPLCQLACMWCGNALFWQWANVHCANGAKDFILQTCGIKSRKELDCNPKAADKFNELIRRPFMAHMGVRL